MGLFKYKKWFMGGEPANNFFLDTKLCSTPQTGFYEPLPGEI